MESSCVVKKCQNNLSFWYMQLTEDQFFMFVRFFFNVFIQNSSQSGEMCQLRATNIHEYQMFPQIKRIKTSHPLHLCRI